MSAKKKTPVVVSLVASEAAQENIRRAFTWFNDKLWNGKLPKDTAVFWHRAPKAAGCFGPHRFKNPTGDFVSEISLNPDHLGQRSEIDILSTLVHEMCHLERLLLDPEDWTGTYHCQKWAEMMDRVGLTPRALGKGGELTHKKTGHRVTHEIVDGGMFDQAAKEFIMANDKLFPLRAVSAVESGILNKRKLNKCKPTSGGSRTSKLSFHCPCCDARIYGKQDTRAFCTGTEDKPHDITLFVLMPKKAK